MGFLAAGDDPQIFGPGRQLVAVGVLAQQGGELDDPDLIQAAGPAVGIEDRVPGIGQGKITIT